jgi:CubicO group peptidase (beta-lactamase class C family)
MGNVALRGRPGTQARGRRSRLVLLVIALIGGTAGLGAQDPVVSPESVGFSADGLKAFQRTMRALVDESKLAGVTTLVARHGKVVHVDAYGVRDLATKKPVATDTIFRLASMTKPIVGVAMMMLWEQGKWTLDDPVAKHIPEFAGLKVATPKGEVPQAKPMTMRQLMSHTAGFDVTTGMKTPTSGIASSRFSP